MSRKEKWQLLALCTAIWAASVLIIGAWVLAKLSTEGYLS